MHPYKRLVEWLYMEKIMVMPTTLAQGDIISGIYASRVKAKYTILWRIKQLPHTFVYVSLDKVISKVFFHDIC